MSRLLVVDDDRRISMALCVRLRAAGFEVECAYDGDEAYATAARSLPDLIIMDINMPGDGGIAAAQNLRGNPDTRGIPVIFITASKETHLRELAEHVGAADFFEKPYHAQDLVQAVELALGRAA